MTRRRTQRRRMRQTKRERVWMRSGGLCAYCGMPLSVREMTMDHVVPRSRGGESRVANLVAACATCNVAKGARTAEEFLAERMEAVS